MGGFELIRCCWWCIGFQTKQPQNTTTHRLNTIASFCLCSDACPNLIPLILIEILTISYLLQQHPLLQYSIAPSYFLLLELAMSCHHGQFKFLGTS